MNVHPFVWVRESARTATFWACTVIAVLAMATLQVVGAPLKTPAAPVGILSFELAGSLLKADEMLSSWDAMAKTYAAISLGFDFLFIPAYVASIGLGCVLIAESLGRFSSWLSTAGIVLAWGMLLAGTLDCVENYALIRLLLGSQSETWAIAAKWCAIPKFAIVVLSILYVVSGTPAVVFNKERSGARA